MAKNKKRPLGKKHLLEARAERMAARLGEDVQALREMMEISKTYANREIGRTDPDTATYDITVLDPNNIVTPPTTLELPLATPEETARVIARSLPDDYDGAEIPYY